MIEQRKKSCYIFIPLLFETVICSMILSKGVWHMNVQKMLAISILAVALVGAFFVSYVVDVINDIQKNIYRTYPVGEIVVFFQLGLACAVLSVYLSDYLDIFLLLPVAFGVSMGIGPAIVGQAMFLSLAFLYGGIPAELVLFYFIPGIVAVYMSNCLKNKNQYFYGLVILFMTQLLSTAVCVFFCTQRFALSVLGSLILGAFINVTGVAVLVPYIMKSRNRQTDMLLEVISPKHEIMMTLKNNKTKVYEHGKRTSQIASRAAKIIGADEVLTVAICFYYNYARTLGKNYVDPFIENAYWRKIPQILVDNVVAMSSQSREVLSKEASIALVAETLCLAKESRYRNGIAEPGYLEALLRQKVTKGLLDMSEMTMREYAIIKSCIMEELCGSVQEEV